MLCLQDPRKIRATVEKVFRGRKYKNLVDICSTSYKADYKLIPKSEEENFCKIDKVSEEKVCTYLHIIYKHY